jgi:hypothetical protein
LITSGFTVTFTSLTVNPGLAKCLIIGNQIKLFVSAKEIDILGGCKKPALFAKDLFTVTITDFTVTTTCFTA